MNIPPRNIDPERSARESPGFARHGVPLALRRDEHRRLAEYFGLPERALGIRDLWAHAS